MTGWTGVDTIWAGVWTELDIGIDSLGLGCGQFGQGYGQFCPALCTASCTYIM